mmetsp:Transcript_29001/g.65481  ORF Transcript_29001/g.65481 Transcript_29001/m.65481 type:complete len:227 (-) Transcript_29001:666-1346(-)
MSGSENCRSRSRPIAFMRPAPIISPRKTLASILCASGSGLTSAEHVARFLRAAMATRMTFSRGATDTSSTSARTGRPSLEKSARTSAKLFSSYVRHQRQNPSSYSCWTDELTVRSPEAEGYDCGLPELCLLSFWRSWRERYLIPPDAAKICLPSVALMSAMVAGTVVPTVVTLELLSCDMIHAVSASSGSMADAYDGPAFFESPPRWDGHATRRTCARHSAEVRWA